jgi:hypothetical protein
VALGKHSIPSAALRARPVPESRSVGDCILGPSHQHSFTLWDGRQCEHCMLTKDEIAWEGPIGRPVPEGADK